MNAQEIRAFADRLQLEIDLVAREAGASPEELATVLAFIANPDESYDRAEITDAGEDFALDVLTDNVPSANPIELPSPCGCGECGECRNAAVMYAAHGRVWEDWSAEAIRGALAALESLGRTVAREGKN